MGMTRSFYYIVNKGLSRERIREALSELSSRENFALTPKIRQTTDKMDGGDKLWELLETAVQAAKPLDKGDFVVWREGGGAAPLF